MKKVKIQHTKRTFAITLILLIAAVGFQVGWSFILYTTGMKNNMALWFVLTLFPGGTGWYVAFRYAFSLPRIEISTKSVTDHPRHSA